MVVLDRYSQDKKYEPTGKINLINVLFTSIYNYTMQNNFTCESPKIILLIYS